MKKQKIKKSTSGITLIALVITIIVLLILAGISIATLTGKNGLLTKADTAKKETEIESAKEQAKIDIAAWIADKLENGEKAELDDSIVKSIITGKDYVSTEEGQPGDSSFKTKENGYEIPYSDLYKKTTSSEGKTIADLYDGNNDWTDTENYNENGMHIGDYVNYKAGSWDETKAAPTSSTPCTFGGYTAGQSRDTNAMGSSTYTKDGITYGVGKYEGWRIWDISDDKQTMTLISAGCPEVYYHPYKNTIDYAYISEYILTGNINTDAEGQNLGLGSTYIAKDWSMYKNANLYAASARALSKSDIDTWYRKYIDSSITDPYLITLPLNTKNKLISMVENGFFYYLPPAQSGSYLYRGEPDYRCIGIKSGGDAYGVRVLISLVSKVKFKETPEKIEQDGFSYNKWIIE